MPSESPAPAPRRLDLFAFPSETDAFFNLFIAAALLAAIHVNRVFLDLLAPEIMLRYQSLVEGGNLEALLRGRLLAQTLTAMLPLLCAPALLSAAILGAAFFIYRGHPDRLRRRWSLRPLPDNDAAVQQAVSDLAARVGVSPSPTVEMPPGLQGASGQAFGFRGGYRLRLDGGLRAWRRIQTREGWFRAVVLHELAHIVNGDIWRAYFAKAVWTAMIVLSIAPLVLELSGFAIRNLLAGTMSSAPTDAFSALAGALLSGLIYFIELGVVLLIIIATIRAQLLRAREISADWRAAGWGAGAALMQLFRNRAETDNAPARVSLLRLHPTAAQRLAALQQPNRQFRLSWALPFITGFMLVFLTVGVFWLAFPSLILVSEPVRVARAMLEKVYLSNPNMLLGLLILTLRVVWYALLLGGMVSFLGPIAWLLSGVLGSQLQKQAAADLAERRRGITEYLRLAVPAALVTLGMEVGLFVTPFSVFAPRGWAEFAANIAFLIVMAALLWWFLVYGRFISIQMFSTYAGTARPAWRMRAVAWALNGWLFFFLMPGLVFGLVMTSGATETWVSGVIGVFAAWLVAVLIFSPVGVGVSWIMIRALVALRPPRCPACRQVYRGTQPALGSCAHCGQRLGEWLYAPESSLTP